MYPFIITIILVHAMSITSYVSSMYYSLYTIAGTSEASEGGSLPRGPDDNVGEQRFSGCGGAASGAYGEN